MAISISVSVTVPDSILSDANVRAEIERVLKQQTGPDIRKQFKKTTEGWEKEPNFSQKFTDRNSYMSVTVYTNDEIYTLVNSGSPPHRITPRRGGMLRFQPGYSAATRPKIISSRAKRRSGAVIGAFGVSHPGFEARKFDEAIAEEIAPRFAEDIQNAISKAAAK